MANTVNNKTTKTSIKKEEVETDMSVKEIEYLKKSNEEMKEQLKALMEMMSFLNNKNQETKKEEDSHKYTPVVSSYNNTSDEIPEEPSPNKMVRIISLCRGSLNLAKDERGLDKLKFTKYGEIKPVLYSTLINIVNNNRKFAERGLFYILDKASVYYLGLSNVYDKLVDNTVLDNICNYPVIDIEKIIEGMEKSQVEVMVKNLSDRMYNGENFDLNKINAVSRASGIDILQRVNNMKSFAESKK